MAWKCLALVIRSSSRAIPGLRSSSRSSEGLGLEDTNSFGAEFLCFPHVVVVVFFGFFCVKLILIFPVGTPRALKGIGCSLSQEMLPF